MSQIQAGPAVIARAEEAIEKLNEALQIDRVAVSWLFASQVPCSKHLTSGKSLSFLSVLSVLFKAEIVADWSNGTITGFRLAGQPEERRADDSLDQSPVPTADVPPGGMELPLGTGIQSIGPTQNGQASEDFTKGDSY